MSRFLRSQLRRIGPGHPPGRDPKRTSMRHNPALQRQAVLAVNLKNHAFAAGFADRQLGGAFGTLGSLHDLLAELVVASLSPQTGQRLSRVTCS